MPCTRTLLLPCHIFSLYSIGPYFAFCWTRHCKSLAPRNATAQTNPDYDFRVNSAAQLQGKIIPSKPKFPQQFISPGALNALSLQAWEPQTQQLPDDKFLRCLWPWGLPCPHGRRHHIWAFQERWSRGTQQERAQQLEAIR